MAKVGKYLGPRGGEITWSLTGISPVGGNFTVAVFLSTERTDRSNEGGKIDLAGKKRFFVFPNRFMCVRVGKLNFSAPCPRGGQTLGCANLSVSLLAGLGYFTKVNSLPRNLARPYIIGYIILQISGLNPSQLSG